MKRVKAVVVVGGGTAGWLTAGTIAARHQARMKAGGLSVTLIESADLRASELFRRGYRAVIASL